MRPSGYRTIVVLRAAKLFSDIKTIAKQKTAIMSHQAYAVKIYSSHISIVVVLSAVLPDLT